MKNFVENKIPVGLLCYDNSEPKAWCYIAPRDSYKELKGDNSLNNVWSLVCFFIKRAYREQGLIEELISEAVKYAKANGAKYIEAYPVEPDSPSYRFMSFNPKFENRDLTLNTKQDNAGM